MTDRLTSDQQQEARHLLGFLHHQGGFPPGSFTEALIEAFMRADSMNTSRLDTAFPDLGLVIRIWRVEGPDGLNHILNYSAENN